MSACSRAQRALTLLCLAALPGTAHAVQATCASLTEAGQTANESRSFAPPLDRVVSLHARDLSLRDALDRLAATARVRLSYASELLPLDRRVCLSYRDVAIGKALADLLEGMAVQAVATGGDLVVLAPAHGVAAAQRVSPVRRTSSLLDRIVVTGSAAGTSERSHTIALDVLHGADLEQRGATTLAEALSGAVPGIWMWAQPPSRLSARYGSIRGASSFGVSYPKIYIDGVEVANPLILTDVNPEAVERVEVIRGPQGAALYGSDAISGVINILLRHDGVGPSGDRLQLRTGAGVSGSSFATHDVLAQEHALSFRTGTSTRSAGVGLNMSTLGEFMPGAYSRSAGANGDMRVIGARSSLTMSGRLFSERVGTPSGLTLASPAQPQLEQSPAAHLAHGRGAAPEMPDSVFAPPPSAFDSTAPQRVRHYTLGATAAIMPDARWTHTVVLGLDGYNLANVAVDGGPIPTPADSALLAARGRADRVSVRLSSVARFGTDDHRSGAITFALDHSRLHEMTSAGEIHVGQSGPGPGPGPGFEVDEWSRTAYRSTAGASGQADVALQNKLFVTGGLRLERTSGYSATSEVSALPLLGAAFVIDNGRTTLKVRSAYGKGIRPPRTTLRTTGWTLWRPGSAEQELAPEEQVGVEVGADLLFARTAVLRLTRFDQKASGLIQPVAVYGDPRLDGPSHERRFAYELQNVGEIANSGWEVEGSLRLGRVALGGALALVDSRVEKTASGYSGDLRVGDRVLEVPKRTLSLNASWLGSAWSTTVTLARAQNWINYDRVALNEAVLSPNRSAREFVGATLRSFWREYDGVTRLNATFYRDLIRGVSLVFSGDNLLGYQEGEPDNVTVLPGRTVIAGLRFKF